jgi:acetyl esterase/lipase
MKTRYLLALAIICIPLPLPAQTPAAREQMDVPYLKAIESDPYISERCRVDLYLPVKSTSPFPILVWFHGGALEGGARNGSDQKALARRFAAQGIGVVMAGYRLSPRVQFPEYVKDAAVSVKWVVDNAAKLGGDPNRIFVGGHSAGAYLAALLAMDPHFLREAGLSDKSIAGFIPMSGQMMTHFTVRKEHGVANSQSLVAADEAAPIFHLRKDTAPILLIIGDKDWPARLEENQFFAAAMEKVAKNERVSLLVVPDRDHGSIVTKCLEPGDPAGQAMVEMMTKVRESGQ